MHPEVKKAAFAVGRRAIYRGRRYPDRVGTHVEITSNDRSDLCDNLEIRFLEDGQRHRCYSRLLSPIMDGDPDLLVALLAYGGLGAEED